MRTERIVVSERGLPQREMLPKARNDEKQGCALLGVKISVLAVALSRKTMWPLKTQHEIECFTLYTHG